MYLIDSIVTLFTLPWSQPKPSLRPIPSHIKRTYVDTPGGPLELLVCESKVAAGRRQTQPPIFFAHGGCGSAGVWLEWINYLHDHGYTGTLYAYSVRNHGGSYTLPYWRMVWKTPFEHIQADMMSCLTKARDTERQVNPDIREPIIVGHSSGGGLAQSLLSGSSPDNLRTKASGLCLVGAITSWGSYDLYWNWWKHDPWFPLRSLLHLQHPNSPLSTDQLVHAAFFGHNFPLSQAAQFRRWMPHYESMGWPTGMLGDSLWSWMRGNPKWLSTKDIYSNLQNGGDGRDKVCVMVGKEDMMYRSQMWERQCKEYRDALAHLKEEKKVEEMRSPSSIQDEESIEAVSVKSKGGVRLVLVEESGHHVQNDVYHEQAAEAFLRWANQV